MLKFTNTIMRRLSGVILSILFILTAVNIHAQSTTQGAIAGSVTDSSGAAIPNAAIVIHNDATNAEIKVTADATGYYKAALVPPGIYTVQISVKGFGVYKASSVAVTVGSLSEVDAALKTGTVQENVIVSGEVPLIKLESADISSTITAKEIVDLPLNGGRWSNLALLTPTAVANSSGFGLISFRGISTLLNTVEIDGADDNQAYFSEERGRTREGYSTSQIAIAEFQVNTGVYSAEYGRAAGGVLNAVTKSGSNTIHGQAYFYDRDNEWGAFNPFTTLTSVSVPTGGGNPVVATNPFKAKDWRKRWGFGIGGPILHDKLFFFYAFDQYKRNFPGVSKPSNPGVFFGQWADMSLPTGAACSTNTATNATKTLFTVSSGTATTGDIYACALAARLYGYSSSGTSNNVNNYALAAAQYNQLLFGTAVSSVTGLSNPGLYDDVSPVVPRTGDEVLNTPKLDWQINQKEHLSVLYHRERWDSPGGVQTQTSNNYALDTFGTDFVKLDYGLIKLDSLINSNLSNEVRFQYGRELDDEGQQPWSSFSSKYLNNSTGTPVQLSIYGSTPSASSTNYGFTAGMPYYSFRAAYPEEYKTQLGDTANWTKKQHNWKFGFDVLRNHDKINNLYESNGVFTYTTFSDFFADILKPSGTCDSSENYNGLGTLPCYYGFTQGFGSPEFALRTWDYGFFLQDDWKLRHNLTLNAGIRYEYEHIPSPYQNLISTSIFTTKGDSTYAVGNHPNNVTNFGPRVGLSWSPFSNNKSVLHIGWGLYYGRVVNATILNTYLASGTPNGQYTISSVFGKPTSSTVPAFPQVIGSGAFPTPSIDFFQKHFRNPDVQQYDLSIQRELPWGLVTSLTYNGSLGQHLPNFLNVNLNPAKTYSSVLTVAPASGTTSCGPLACGTQVTSNVYSSILVDTNYGSATEVISNINSNYNALIFDIENRGNKYAQFDINYTWGHALDYNQNESTSPSTNNWYDPLANPRLNYGNSIYNVPNRVVAWALFTSPNIFKGIPGYFTNGFHFNPIFTWQTGLPYTAGVSGKEPSFTTGGVTYKPYNSGLNGSGTSTWIPQLGRNSFAQPDTYVLDVRLQKDLRINERYNFELVGEVFNLINHQNVTAMNTTAYSITAGTNTSSNAVGTLVYNPPTGSGVTAAGFGTINNSNSNFSYTQRQIQIGLKFDF
jgi:hypothetical protein